MKTAIFLNKTENSWKCGVNSNNRSNRTVYSSVNRLDSNYNDIVYYVFGRKRAKNKSPSSRRFAV